MRKISSEARGSICSGGNFGISSPAVMWKKGNVPNELNVLAKEILRQSFKGATYLLVAIYSKIQVEERSY